MTGNAKVIRQDRRYLTGGGPVPDKSCFSECGPPLKISMRAPIAAHKTRQTMQNGAKSAYTDTLPP